MGEYCALTMSELVNDMINTPRHVKARSFQRSLSNRGGSVSVPERIQILRLVEQYLQSGFQGTAADQDVQLLEQTKTKGARPAAASRSNTKTITFMRHGQGEHNVASKEWAAAGNAGTPYTIENDPQMRYEDAVLTEQGQGEAAALRQRLQQLDPIPQLVVVSPMRRATMTALSACQHLVGQVPFVAHEECHEMGGKHTCDKRLDVSLLSELFPQIDYSPIAHESDPLWGAERETWEALAERALRFMTWLWSRPEQCIAVACHGSFLVTLFAAVLRIPGGVELAFGTGEMRTVSVTYQSDFNPDLDSDLCRVASELHPKDKLMTF